MRAAKLRLPTLTFLLALGAAAAHAQAPEQPPRLAAGPSADDFAKFYPTLAHLYLIEGYAALTCMVDPSGRAHDCHATSEGPPGLGFGRAAEKLSGAFRFTPGTTDGKPADKPWTSKVAFRLGEEPPVDPVAPDLPPERLKLAADVLAALDVAPEFKVQATAADGRKDCQSNGGTMCDQFAKAVEAAAIEDNARVRAELIAWIATTYGEDELRAYLDPAAAATHDMIEKAGDFAVTVERTTARAVRDSRWLVGKHYCELVGGCPTAAATIAPSPSKPSR